MLGAIGLMLGASAVLAWEVPPPDDFLTGGGWILRASGAKANFGVGGGTKNGNWWGHLEYIDHGTGLNVHWTSITGYFFLDDGSNGTDPKTGQPTGTRGICGTARTNQFGDVNFAVRARDAGEPGTNDQFDILLTNPSSGATVYSTLDECFPHYLGSGCSAGNGGGGNIQLHKPNPSTTGSFGGSCPAYPAFQGQ